MVNETVKTALLEEIQIEVGLDALKVIEMIYYFNSWFLLLIH